MDVGENTTTGNGDSSKQFIQLFVVLDCQSDVTGHDSRLLVVASSVSGKLKNLGAEVLQDGSKVDGGSSSHTGGILSGTQVSADTTNRELQTCLGRCGGGLLGSTASFSFSWFTRKARTTTLGTYPTTIAKKGILYSHTESCVPDIVNVFFG